MVAWGTLPLGDEPPFMRDYAEIWRAADKIVYSTTLDEVSTPRTRIERSFRARLVDECHLFIAPVLVGGGASAFPDGVRLGLELADERRFGNGMIYLRYRVER